MKVVDTGIDKLTRCIDLGCGEGKSFLEYDIDLKGIELHLVDQHSRVTDVQLLEAPGVYIHEMDIVEYLEMLPDESIDFILIQDVLEHLTPETALRLLILCKSKLKKHGVVFGRVPNGNSPFSLRNQNNDKTHKTYWGNRALAATAKRAGFSTPRVCGAYEILPGHLGFIRSIVTKLVFQPIATFLLMPYIGWSGESFWTANICFQAVRD